MKQNPEKFEIKSTDLGARIGVLRTKTSEFETPALLPVIHPVRQLLPCSEIKSMGYEAVMTNAYTTFRRLSERASEGIHRIIGFDGSVMTDSGGYQVLEFGSIDISPEEMTLFQEKLNSDIAIVLDEPTGLKVDRAQASRTVSATLRAAKATMKVATREDIIWTLPIQGGKYLDLVSKSAETSAKLAFGCFALGSPVEVMEEYNFSLLVEMIVSSKRKIPQNRPFHLFGAGHPLVIPLAISLGCDMFDSASYMLYAREDRYISQSGTIRVAELEYLGCSCKACTSLKASELKRMEKGERTLALARHNLHALKQKIDETKQAIWEGKLWEYLQSSSRTHPKVLEALRKAIILEAGRSFEEGTASFKDRGVFIFDKTDLGRPELSRHRKKIKSLDLSKKYTLSIVPETKTKPFLSSKIYQELARLVSTQTQLIVSANPIFGLVPAEISDVYPLSQITSSLVEFPKKDPILRAKKWKKINILFTKHSAMEKWLREELSDFLGVTLDRLSTGVFVRGKTRVKLQISKSYKSFKRSVGS